MPALHVLIRGKEEIISDVPTRLGIIGTPPDMDFQRKSFDWSAENIYFREFIRKILVENESFLLIIIIPGP